MLIMVCDRCGKQREPNKGMWFEVTTKHLKSEEETISFLPLVQHVCGDCQELKWINEEED